MPEFRLRSEQWVPLEIESVFAFFAEAGNLERLTPPWLRFRVLTPEPIRMAEGTEIDYLLRLRGIPMKWRSRITDWQPGRRFVDEQIKGPYRFWRHEHEFTARDGGTEVRDCVAYAVPGGRLANHLLVRRDLRRVFGYRQEQLALLLGSDPRYPPSVAV